MKGCRYVRMKQKLTASEGFQLVAGDKRSAITGEQDIENAS